MHALHTAAEFYENWGFFFSSFWCQLVKFKRMVVTDVKLKPRPSQRLIFEETGAKKLFEACRCFHILKEINICVHFDSDCTVQLQINNYNHKRPRDRLWVGLSFFTLWQIWILLLQGSKMTLFYCVATVCVYVLLYLCFEGIQISLESMNCVRYITCVGG